MKTKNLSLKISDAIGKVSAQCFIPATSKCVLTLAHGAGAGMDHAFMVTLSQSLADTGIATMRFNFPFAEHKKGRPDSPAIAHQTIEAALNKAQELFPSLPLFAAGKSFGGRMSSQYLAANTNKAVKGLIFYGFPLHPAGKPGIERADHLQQIKVPMLFLQGSKDALATWELIEPVCKKLKKARLIRLEGADHSFKAGKKVDTMAVLVAETTAWVDKLL